MIKTPSDFNKISKIEESDGQSLLLSLICPCGKQDFSILINTNDPNLPKKQELFDSLIKKYGGYGHCYIFSDNNCRVYINYKGIRGLFTKPKLIDSNIIPTETKIVKAKCLHCGKEFLLYDNRKHGDAKLERKLDYSNFTYKEITINKKVKIKLEYDITMNQYEQKYLFSNKNPYEECFSYIKIFYVQDNKEIIIFEDEM